MDELKLFEVETWFDNEEWSVAFIVLKGINKVTLNKRSTTTYEVISGQGIFHTTDKVTPVEAGSTITILSETFYYDEGDLVMCATSVPAFRQEDVEVLDS